MRAAEIKTLGQPPRTPVQTDDDRPKVTEMKIGFIAHSKHEWLKVTARGAAALWFSNEKPLFSGSCAEAWAPKLVHRRKWLVIFERSEQPRG